LGDRHVANILVEKSSAEVIHIDFGVAFEQGKLLPIPETVPFRLTRDIINGMGITGAEGVFRRSCERTLEVLRQNKEIILMLLEVLLYDPLYSWSLTPQKVATLQKETKLLQEKGGDPAAPKTSDTNKHAKSILLKLQEKLEGTEGGASLSTSGQVNYLIKQAVDPKNLALIYFGWQAYL